MTSNTPSTAKRPLPTAQAQTSLPPERVLQSTNVGVVIELTGQLKQGLRTEARRFTRELVQYVNRIQEGVATVALYDEAFATHNRIHCLINVRSLHDYETLVNMSTDDEGFRNILDQYKLPADKGGGSWETLFVDGSMKQTVMLPQFRRMYGAADRGAEGIAAEKSAEKPLVNLPGAQHQFTLPMEKLLHSANCGLMIHRTAQLKYAFRSEGRQFARDVVDSINTKSDGEATSFLYEEAFGSADRLHWLIHLKTVSSYYPLIKMHAADPEVRELYFKETLPPEKGGGNWSRMFVEGSMVDTAFTPQDWSR